MTYLQKAIRKIQSLTDISPGGCVDLTGSRARDYAREKSIRLETYQLNQTLQVPPPTWIGEEPVNSPLQPFDSYLDVWYLEIENPKFRLSNHHLLDDDRRVIYHPGLQFEYLPVSRQKLPARVKKLSGTVAYLSNTAADHYGHWMRLTLPTLRIYQKYNLLSDIDYFYVGDMAEVPAFILECFRLLEIPVEKIVHFPCRADRILAAFTKWKHQNNRQAYLDQSSYQFVRDLVFSRLDLGHNCCYGNRVYVSRGDVQWRDVRNEETLVELLNYYDFDFRVMNSLSVSEQAQIFYHAKVIIAPHGSALTNFLFAKPHTKVLEIFPHNYIDKTSFALAAYSQLDYYAMQGKAIENIRVEACYEDIEVDIEKLQQFLKGIV